MSIGILVVFSTVQFLSAAEPTVEAEVLSTAQWERVDDAVERGLRWLDSQQQRDGSFATSMEAQPAVTDLCAMAFMANGHSASEGPYGETLKKAIDYIISHQRPNGLITAVAPPGTIAGITRVFRSGNGLDLACKSRYRNTRVRLALRSHGMLTITSGVRLFITMRFLAWC